MQNRKESDVEYFIEEIERHWRLSIVETEFLESVFNLVLLKKDITQVSNVVNFFFAEEWENLLNQVPKLEIKDFAETYLDMIAECDISDEKILEDFDDDEFLDEYNRRGLNWDEDRPRIDIVLESQMGELKELFFNLSFAEKNELIEKLRK